MKYLFLVYLDEKKWLGMPAAERQQIMDDSQPHVDRLLANGTFLAGSPLQPVATASTIRLDNGKPLVTDGPFAETREQVGGYTLVDAADMHEALAIAANFLGTRSIASIEIRPLADAPGIPSH